MRITALILALVLLTAPAWAEVDVSVDLDITDGGSGWHYSNGNWIWSDTGSLRGVHFRSGGLTIGFEDGDWRARLRTVPRYYPLAPQYYPQQPQYFPQSSSQNRSYYNGRYHIKPTRTWQGNIPGRNGYSVAIPRSTEGEPERYGEWEYNQYGELVPAGSGNFHSGINYNHNRYNRSGYPLVFHYSLGYPYYYGTNYPYYYNQPAVVYRASDRDYYNYDPGYYDTGREEIRADEVNVYQGDVNNYYYDNQPAPAPQPVQPAVAPAPAPEPAVAEPPITPGVVAYGSRFYETARLETGDTVRVFAIQGGNLSVRNGDGPSQPVCDLVHPALGAYAAYNEETGLTVLFARDNRIAAAYEADGTWLVEPVPYPLDFTGKTTLGLVGGAPWAVFDSTDGNRYVLAFVDHQWQEIGSGST